jgi:hypothetical protein
MKPFSFIFLLVFLLNTAYASNNDSDTLCGPRSLLLVLDHFGISSSLKEICTLADYNETTGANIAGLVKAAKSKGLPALPVRLDIDDLCSIGLYSILYVRESHFVVFEKCVGDSILGFNDKRSCFTLPRNTFIKSWGGEAIVFSDSLYKTLGNQQAKLKTKEPSAAIKFPTYIHDFGLVDEGTVLNHTFTFRNTGSKPLDIYTRTSCGCTAAVLSEKNIQPGKTGKIQVEFKTQGRHKGINKVMVMVRSNDPENKVVSLTLTAIIRGRIAVIPDKVFWGDLYRDSKITREIRVRDSGDGKLKVIRVKTPEWITAQILSPKVDSDSVRYYPISMTINGMSNFGKYEENAIIYTNDNKQLEIPVKISGNVVSRLTAFPQRAFFDNVSTGSTTKQEITITPPQGKSIDVNKMILSNSSFKTEVTPSGNSYKVTVIFNAPEIETVIKDSLNIYLPGQIEPEMEIPVFARVVAK